MWRNARRRQQKSSPHSARSGQKRHAAGWRERLCAGLRAVWRCGAVEPAQTAARLPARCAAGLRTAFAALRNNRRSGALARGPRAAGGGLRSGLAALQRSIGSACRGLLATPRRAVGGLGDLARRAVPRRRGGNGARRDTAPSHPHSRGAPAASTAIERSFGASLAPGNRRLNLALQGGGAHGAFTWGVLDRLLEERKLDFEGVSGTSAGAMNAAVLAQGLMDGGREGARAALGSFWHSVSPALPLSPRASEAALNLTRHFSPYQLNPLDVNPLRDTVERHVDFAALRRNSPVKLFIAATRVRSGSLVLFREGELDCDRLLASACLPSVHRAVEIDGEAYWDGGFSANPAIYPLLEDCRCGDNLLVLLQPVDRPQTPRSSEAIAERIGELSFGSAFTREMQDIARRGAGGGARFHLIQDEELMRGLDRRSKYDTRRAFLDSLFEAGRQQADAWLRRHRRHIGSRASIDIGKLFG